MDNSAPVRQPEATGVLYLPKRTSQMEKQLSMLQRLPQSILEALLSYILASGYCIA